MTARTVAHGHDCRWTVVWHAHGMFIPLAFTVFSRLMFARPKRMAKHPKSDQPSSSATLSTISRPLSLVRHPRASPTWQTLTRPREAPIRVSRSTCSKIGQKNANFFDILVMKYAKTGKGSHNLSYMSRYVTLSLRPSKSTNRAPAVLISSHNMKDFILCYQLLCFSTC